MTPTAQQATYVEALLTTSNHTALIARAGCGKTSTILLGVQAILKATPRAEIVVAAYNKAIADEVGEKLKVMGLTDWRQVQASTMHSLGFGLLRFAFKPTIDDKKVRKLVDQRNDDISAQYSTQIISLVGYAKQAGVGFFPDSPIGNVQVWHDLADHFDVNGLDDTSEADAVVEAAQAVYRASLAQTDIIDFDDMILFPLIKNMRVRFGKDHIFLDEAQDASRVRQALARKFLKPGGRLHVVGDDRQAIYGFSGADAAALDNLVREMGCAVYPLNVTWRCPKAVVALAQTIVPDIEAAPSAPEGEVSSVSGKEAIDALVAGLGPTDAVLCRNTAPLIELAFRLIRQGKPCKVEGRAIGDGLINLAQRWKVKTIDAFLGRLEAYQDREMQKALAKGSEAKAQEVEDRCETLRTIAQACVSANKTQVSDIVAYINELFADGATGVTVLATAHRSKGREWPRVVLWGNNRYAPSRAAKQAWQQSQEQNLIYVMFTRAQRELVFVDLP